MSYRNFIIENIYSLFKNELDERLNIELTMDSSRNNNEVMNADVIYSDSVVVDPDGKILSLKIKNTSGNSFLSLDKRLDGKKVLINNSEWGTIVEHQINNFDYEYDYVIVQGDFLTIKKIDDVKEFSIRNSDIIYLYVRNGNLPKLSAFNRMYNKSSVLLFQFQIISKDDGEHRKIEEYTEAFYDIYYGKYKRSFPIYDKVNRKILTYTTSSSYDLTIDDFLVKSDNVVVRIITIPIMFNVNYFSDIQF